MDKSITFHYCTVICDVLWPIDIIFLKRQHKLYLIFCISIFLKCANLRFSVNVQKPKEFQLKGAPDPLTRGSASEPRWDLRPQAPSYRGLTLAFGLASNSLTPALRGANVVKKA